MSNKIFEAFDAVRADDALRRQTLEFLDAARAKRRPAQRPAFRIAMAAVCALLLLSLGFGGYAFYRVPVSYISIDVNPSVELSLNRLNRVVAAAAYNGDGDALLNGLVLNGLSYTDAIDSITARLQDCGYLTEDARLVFTVAASGDALERSLMRGIEHCSGSIEHGGVCAAADPDTLSAAHGCGLSFGKYAAYLELSAYDDSITAEDCRGMSMREIHARIRAQADGEAATADGDACAQRPAATQTACDAETASAPAASAAGEHASGEGRHGHGGHGTGTHD